MYLIIIKRLDTKKAKTFKNYQKIFNIMTMAKPISPGHGSPDDFS